MTDHIQLLGTPEHEASISKVFPSVGRRYVQYFNYTYTRSGTLWRDVAGRQWWIPTLTR